MRTVRVEGPEGALIDLPAPTRVNRVARPIYKVMLAIVAALAVGALLNDPSSLLWLGCALYVLPLPAHLYVEYKIKRSAWTDSRKYRDILFVTEALIPLLIMPAMVTAQDILEAYGLAPTLNQLTMIILGTMLAVGFTSVLANRAWALGLLGLER